MSKISWKLHGKDQCKQFSGMLFEIFSNLSKLSIANKSLDARYDVKFDVVYRVE